MAQDSSKATARIIVLCNFFWFSGLRDMPSIAWQQIHDSPREPERAREDGDGRGDRDEAEVVVRHGVRERGKSRKGSHILSSYRDDVSTLFSGRIT